jgi:hypothetical protein
MLNKCLPKKREERQIKRKELSGLYALCACECVCAKLRQAFNFIFDAHGKVVNRKYANFYIHFDHTHERLESTQWQTAIKRGFRAAHKSQFQFHSHKCARAIKTDYCYYKHRPLLPCLRLLLAVSVRRCQERNKINI